MNWFDITPIKQLVTWSFVELLGNSHGFARAKNGNHETTLVLNR